MLRQLKIVRLINTLLLAMVLGFACVGTAVAQAPPKDGEKKEEKAGKSYILPYSLVVMCIALGLVVVCRTSNRERNPKFDAED